MSDLDYIRVLVPSEPAYVRTLVPSGPEYVRLITGQKGDPGDPPPVEMMGAKSDDWDSDFDNAEAFERVFQSGKIHKLSDGKWYRIKRRVECVDGGGGIAGNPGSGVWGDVAEFDNQSAAPGDYALPNACMFYLHGGLEAPYTPIDRVTLRGFAIKMRNLDPNGSGVVNAVVARNIPGFICERMEIGNFPAGKAIWIDSCPDASIRFNNLHDFYCNADATVLIGGQPQLTGVQVDDDRVDVADGGLMVSHRIAIEFNTIRNFYCGPQFRAAFGQQMDGINMKQLTTLDWSIQCNRIERTGEGIDTFAHHGVIKGNTILYCYFNGMKIIHGAQHLTIVGNFVFGWGHYGIAIWGSSPTNPYQTSWILIEGNEVIGASDPDYTFAAGDHSACIAVDSGGSPAQKPTHVLIKGNLCDPGPADLAMWQRDGTDCDFILNKGKPGLSGIFSRGYSDVWHTGAAYVVGNRALYHGQIYSCLVAHTSGATFPPDLAAGYWQLVTDGWGVYIEATEDTPLRIDNVGGQPRSQFRVTADQDKWEVKAELIPSYNSPEDANPRFGYIAARNDGNNAISFVFGMSDGAAPKDLITFTPSGDMTLVGRSDDPPELRALADATSPLPDVDFFITPKGAGLLRLPGGGTALLKFASTPANQAGSGAGTLTNAPHAGNPDRWLALSIGGILYKFPAWT